MSGINLNFDVVNQKGTPAFYSDIFANRPNYGYPGRVFISTDTGAIYEDTGSAWTLIADAGAGTTGTLQQVTTNGNSTTLPIIVQNMLLSAGAGTGANNTGLGINALVSNTTGLSNTAIGSGTLLNNTTGNYNTAIGKGALTSNIASQYNTAIGYNSLQSNLTGEQNTSIGYNSLNANTTGASNTAIGSGALQLNTTANNNTCIGFASLQSNTTGADNTALGTSVLVSNSTGQRNTGIGSSALSGITTGSNNTTIGYLCGSAIQTGSNNTIIGNYAGTSALASNIVLSDGAGNVRLYSNATGLIGINQVVGTPSAQVDIHTTQTYGLAVNGTTTNNAYLGFANAGTYKWRIGNTYNAGANSLDFYNVGTSTTALSFNATTNVASFIASINVGTGTLGRNSFSQSDFRIAAPNDANILNGIAANTSMTIKTDYYGGGSATPLILQSSSNSNQLYLATTGNVLVGNSTDDTVNKLQVTGSVKISNLAGTGSRAVLADASGNLSAPVSDISVKQNIQTIGYGLSEILKMNPVWFDYIDEYKNYGESRQNGNIAQEMETIIPEAVFTTPSTGKMGINYDQLHAVYIKAIQELKAEIDALKKN